MAMTLADEISRSTANYDPAISRLKNGDIIFLWPRLDVRGNAVSQEDIASAIGIESDMITKLTGTFSLHVPADIARSQAK